MKAETKALWGQLFNDISQFEDYRKFKAEMGGKELISGTKRAGRACGERVCLAQA